jgi:hypothetical protein
MLRCAFCAGRRWKVPTYGLLKHSAGGCKARGATPSHDARKKAINVEDKTKSGHDRPNPAWTELKQNEQDDPEPAKNLKAAKHVIDRYREALQRLADF